MRRKIVPLKTPASEAELKDWDSRTAALRAGLESGDIVGILSITIMADGSFRVVTRGSLLRQRHDIREAAEAIARVSIKRAG